MAHVRRVELSEIIGELPELAIFDPRSVVSSVPDDLFLCALGFEPRCLALPQLLAESGYRSERAFFFEYDTNAVDNDVNRRELTKCLHTMANSVQALPLKDPDFPNEMRRLLESLSGNGAGTGPKITFDCSVAANRIVVTTMALLCETDADLRVLYSEAATYHPTREEYEAQPANWREESLLGLARGVSDVRPSREIPGQHFDPLPDAIILFPTFKPERSQAVIDYVDPALIGTRGEQIIWLVGIPHLGGNDWRISALKEINGLTSEDVQHEVSTFHYQETLKELDSIYNQLAGTYKLTLSPLGSKMQALGSSLFSYLHPDVRIVFAVPKEYNAAQYSGGCREMWSIDFGSLPKLRERLTRVGMLVVDD
ncbi:MAG: hypothetical protein OXC99_00950 [Chloroflexi bacterium]|nr:hypothetical protein [Chloroflexota bacterium]